MGAGGNTLLRPQFPTVMQSDLSPSCRTDTLIAAIFDTCCFFSLWFWNLSLMRLCALFNRFMAWLLINSKSYLLKDNFWQRYYFFPLYYWKKHTRKYIIKRSVEKNIVKFLKKFEKTRVLSKISIIKIDKYFFGSSKIFFWNCMIYVVRFLYLPTLYPVRFGLKANGWC